MKGRMKKTLKLYFREKAGSNLKPAGGLFLAAVFLILLTIPACGAKSNTTESAYDSAAAPAMGVYEEIAEEEGGAAAPDAELDENAASDRKLIKNVSMTVETEDYAGLVSSVQARVTELGGYTQSYEGYNENSVGNRSAYLTLRIPADRLDEFIERVEELSNIVSRQETVEDVTLTYVDLESRRQMYEEEEERLLALLEQAETLEEIIALESRLTEVRYQLESMESQLRTMDNQVSYSTVYLSIDEVERYTPPAEKGTWERIRIGFSENVYRVGNGIKEFFIGFVISLPILLVLAVLIVVAVLLIRLIIRASEKSNAKRAAQRRNAGTYRGPNPGFGPAGGSPYAGPQTKPPAGTQTGPGLQMGNPPAGTQAGSGPQMGNPPAGTPGGPKEPVQPQKTNEMKESEQPEKADRPQPPRGQNGQ